MLNNYLFKKWTKFSTMGFKPIYTGYTSRYYQIWFSLNNPEGLVKWEVWVKTEENKQHPWCQLTKGLVHHIQRKKYHWNKHTEQLDN